MTKEELRIAFQKKLNPIKTMTPKEFDKLKKEANAEKEKNS